MGKRGTLVIPARLREQLGLQEGTLLVTESTGGEIRLRPALIYEPEVWSPERKAYFMLMNSLTKEEWNRMIPDVLALGVDPSGIVGIEPNRRESLPTDAEWERRMRAAKDSRLQTRRSA